MCKISFDILESKYWIKYSLFLNKSVIISIFNHWLILIDWYFQYNFQLNNCFRGSWNNEFIIVIYLFIGRQWNLRQKMLITLFVLDVSESLSLNILILVSINLTKKTSIKTQMMILWERDIRANLERKHTEIII